MFILALMSDIMDMNFDNPDSITSGAAALMILFWVLRILYTLIVGWIEDRRTERERVKGNTEVHKAEIAQDTEQTRLSYETVNQQQSITTQTLQMLASLMTTSTNVQEGIRKILEKDQEVLGRIDLTTTDIHKKTELIHPALDALADRLETPLLQVLGRGEMLAEVRALLLDVHTWVANDRAAWEKQMSFFRERNVQLQKTVDSLKPSDSDVGDVPPIAGEGTDNRAAASNSEVAGTA